MWKLELSFLIPLLKALAFADCPQLSAAGSGANRTPFANGANGAFPAGERQWGKRDERESTSWKDRERDHEHRGGVQVQHHRANYRSEREHGVERRDEYRQRSRSRTRSLEPRVRRRTRSRSTDVIDSRDREKRRRMG